MLTRTSILAFHPRLTSFSLVLILFPGVLLFTSETGTDTRTTLTPLESFLAVQGGILLLAFAMALLFNVRSVRSGTI